MNDDRNNRGHPEGPRPTTQSDAIDIAHSRLGQVALRRPLVCHEHKPSNVRIYGEPTEPCWWVMAPAGDQTDMFSLRSSRVIVVGRETGIVYYDGSAHDEG